MKKVIIGVIIMTVLFSLFYLMGAFVETSFNIALWNEMTRYMVGVMGGIASILLACAFVDINKNNL